MYKPPVLFYNLKYSHMFKPVFVNWNLKWVMFPMRVSTLALPYSHALTSSSAPNVYPLPPVILTTEQDLKSNLPTCVVLSTMQRCPTRCSVARLVCKQLYVEALPQSSLTLTKKIPKATDFLHTELTHDIVF